MPRAGELTVLASALLIAVTAMTGVAFLTDRVGQAVEMRAAESLAADLRLSSTRPFDPEYESLGVNAGMQTARLASMPSVVFAEDANTLAAVRAVTQGYPLRGSLKTSDRLLGEARVNDSIPGPGEAWASPRLMARLGVDTGTRLEVGATTLTLSKVLDFRPDEGWSFVDLAPTLLINEADLAATELIQPGSRVAYRLLISGDRGDIDEFKPINDRFGHDAGDRVLKMVAQNLIDNSRSFDTPGRWGGEEFVIVAINCDAYFLETIAERLRAKVEAEVIEFEGNRVPITIQP